MRSSVFIVLLLAANPARSQEPHRRIYSERWVYAGAQFNTDEELRNLTEIARTSIEHGLTGIVLSGLDRISLASPSYIRRLMEFKSYCDRSHFEIIPSGFNVGYGGAILAHDADLAEGMAVRGALFEAGRTEARFVPDSPAKLVNAGFEDFEGDRFTGFQVQDEPGLKTFADRSVLHSGKASARFENFAKDGIARLEQEIRVTPNRCYRVSAWIRTENTAPAGLFSIKAYTADHRDLSPFEPPVPATSGWTKVTTAFNSWYADRIRLNLGVFEGVRGKVWLDDVELEEVGLMNVVRRDGAPLTIRADQAGTVYEEGRDFGKVSDPKRDFKWTHEMPVIPILAGGRIHEGTRLRVDYYHGTTIYNDQVSACPSMPQVNEIWRQQFALIEKYLAPKKYLLALDEIRLFNRCEACKRRRISAAEMVGELPQRLCHMIHEINPAAEIFVWSDMWDPNHNAVPRYYLVDGELVGTWKFLPKDIHIACWNYDTRRASLDFFSSRGFKTLAAAYYDADDLKNPQGWLESLDTTPGALGIMYTTWQNKYGLLGAFGDLVLKRP
jgi:hypothetical protein